MQPLDDDQLKKLLAQWKAPRAPAFLEARLQAGAPHRWWQWLLTGKVEVPVPLGAITIAVLVLLSALAFRPAPSPAPDPVTNASHFQLVDDLNPRIIRSSYEND
jgi:hypothetical protein